MPAGHWSNGPVEPPTWERTDKHDPGTTADAPSAKYDCLQGTHDCRDSGAGSPTEISPPGRGGRFPPEHRPYENRQTLAT